MLVCVASALETDYAAQHRGKEQPCDQFDIARHVILLVSFFCRPDSVGR
jgi:hypothetical protein